MDYFEYFGIQAGFNIDLNELRKKYYEKSRALHPDFDASQKDDKIFLTAYNNQAYQTLTDSLSRLKYILETNIGPIQENTSLSQDFLMDMMDMHELAIEAKLNVNSTNLEILKEKLNNLENKAIDDTDFAIKAFDRGERSDLIFEALTVYYFKLKYFKRLNQNLEDGSVEV